MRDDTATLLAAGILTYIAETMAHEVIGHGGACLLDGDQFTMLAPLWMRCSRTPPWLTAAGPATNIALAIMFAAILRLTPPKNPLVGLVLWLSFAFNALVACGYLGVGALTGFGDWPFLFQSVTPAIAWRLPAVLIAAVGYFICLRIAAALFQRLAGAGKPAASCLRRRAVIPAAGAAVIAVGAEVYGGRAQFLPLLLATGCTLVVGLSLTSMDDRVAKAIADGRDLGPIPRSSTLIALAAAIATAFILVIGPGLSLS